MLKRADLEALTQQMNGLELMLRALCERLEVKVPDEVEVDDFVKGMAIGRELAAQQDKSEDYVPEAWGGA